MCLGIWAAGMPALLDPNHDLAVGVGYAISNANLYFFGWYVDYVGWKYDSLVSAVISSILLLVVVCRGAMVAAICLAGDFAKQANGDEASPVALKWILLGADSLIIMGTASGVYKDSDCKNANDPSESWNDFCTRTNFAVYFGLCSAVLALSVAAFKQAPFICHTVVALIMLVAWCCAVAFLTFGSGPGTNLGNIYFATWIGFFLTLNLTTTSVRYLIGKGDAAEGPAATEGGEAGPAAAKSVGKQSADPPGGSAPAGDLEKGGSEEEETP